MNKTLTNTLTRLLSEKKIKFVQSMYSNREVGEYIKRSILGCVTPKDNNEIRYILQIANHLKLKLYPISCGKNWGMGSKSPVYDECLIIDLSNMNRIIELDLDQGYAIIEPGVTQYQLFKAIQKSCYMLNVTGSYGDTSIVGNALERGVGFIRQRTEDIAGLEVMLTNEKSIRVGSFWSTGIPQFHFPHGIGPDLRSMFIQSNLGVISSAAISLIAKRDHIVMLKSEFEMSKLDPMLYSLKYLYENGILDCVTKIRKNRNKFFAITSISGNKEIVEFKKQFVTISMRKNFKIKLISEESKNVTETEKFFYNAFCGEPYLGINSLFPSDIEHKDIDNSLIGFRMLTPIIPLNIKPLNLALNYLNKLKLEKKVAIDYTINIINSKAIDLVITLSFLRDQEGIRHCKYIHDIIINDFYSFGFFPYRSDIDHIEKEKIYGDIDYINILQSLKNLFDPNQIISPGRYIPENS